MLSPTVLITEATGGSGCLQQRLWHRWIPSGRAWNRSGPAPLWVSASCGWMYTRGGSGRWFEFTARCHTCVRPGTVSGPQASVWPSQSSCGHVGEPGGGGLSQRQHMQGALTVLFGLLVFLQSLVQKKNSTCNQQQYVPGAISPFFLVAPWINTHQVTFFKYMMLVPGESSLAFFF